MDPSAATSSKEIPPVDHTKGVLRLHSGQIAVALHFIDVGATPEWSANVFTSMELDLLAYQFQVDPSVRSSSRESCAKYSIEFPSTYEYHSEGVTLPGQRRDGAVPVEIRLSCSRFPASALDVWHVVISPDAEAGGWLDEYDLLALIHLYDGRAESTRFRENLRFVRRGGANPASLSATDFLAGLKPKKTSRGEAAGADLPRRERCEFVAGTIQISPAQVDDRLRSLLALVHNARAAIHTQGDQPLGQLAAMQDEWVKSADRAQTDWQKLLAFAGVVVGIFDFEAVDVEELVDTLTPTFTDGRISIQINRCTLLAFTPQDRVLAVDAVREQIGISPYLLLPHAALLNNETLVGIAQAKLEAVQSRIRAMAPGGGRHDSGASKDAGVHSLQELERLFACATRHLGEHQLPNIFNYFTERTLFEQGAVVRGSRDKHKAVEAMRLDVKEQIELQWKWRGERGQIWVAAIGSALSVVPLRALFHDVFQMDDQFSAACALGIAVVLFVVVCVVRYQGLRKS